MRFFWLVGSFFALVGAAWPLSPDATRDQVIAELGKPSSVAKMGQREIMIYPKGVRLEFEGGRIVSAKGIILDESVAAPVEPATAEPAKPQPAPTASEKGKSAGAKISAKPDEQDEIGKGSIGVENAIEQMEKKHEQGQHPAAAKPFDFIGFTLGLVLKFLLTVSALKLSCKSWGAEVFWDTILTVCAVDVAVGGVMTLAGELLLGFPTLFNADDLVGGIVMLFLLKKLSVNHAISQAIQLTLTTKTFSIVVGSFLVTVILRMLH